MTLRHNGCVSTDSGVTAPIKPPTIKVKGIAVMTRVRPYQRALLPTRTSDLVSLSFPNASTTIPMIISPITLPPRLPN